MKLIPKPPELLQKIEWIRLYGKKHWKLLVIAFLFISVPGVFKYFFSTKRELPEKTQKPRIEETENRKEIKKRIPRLRVRFSDGIPAEVEMTVQVQLDPDLVVQAASLFGSAEAAASSLQTSIRGAAMAILEAKTENYVRKNREKIALEIIARTKDAQERTAYKIIELSIVEIN